ncbi:hypothetical protein KNP414_06880 [Paenibacillus mucilaginosus KNP414]|uniref:Uncharacterized protein n=1 Tax=Paenibacillus mucilaginosus (strain KNP414) TaxID=1036673 RepID=F8FGM1_PAEMK|nr:hypothetical protein KNP414_06880 [Paenibacillus mucilaginosus KNP414]
MKDQDLLNPKRHRMLSLNRKSIPYLRERSKRLQAFGYPVFSESS